MSKSITIGFINEHAIFSLYDLSIIKLDKKIFHGLLTADFECCLLKKKFFYNNPEEICEIETTSKLDFFTLDSISVQNMISKYNTIALEQCDGPSVTTILKHVNPSINTLIFRNIVDSPSALKLTSNIKNIVTFVYIDIYDILPLYDPRDKEGNGMSPYVSLKTLSIFDCDKVLNYAKKEWIFYITRLFVFQKDPILTSIDIQSKPYYNIRKFVYKTLSDKELTFKIPDTIKYFYCIGNIDKINRLSETFIVNGTIRDGLLLTKSDNENDIRNVKELILFTRRHLIVWEKNSVSLNFINGTYESDYRYIKILVNENNVYYVINDNFEKLYTYTPFNITSVNH